MVPCGTKDLLYKPIIAPTSPMDVTAEVINPAPLVNWLVLVGIVGLLFNEL